MSDEAAFLEKITAEPEDDTHRLVYADWLDEHSCPERAEFIRLQCAIALLEAAEPKGKDSMYLAGYRLALHRNAAALAWITGEPCRCVLCLGRRERELLVNFPAAPYWLGEADPFRESHPHRDVSGAGPVIRCHGKGVREVQFHFRRGFAEDVVGAAEDVVPHLNTLRSRHPLRRVEPTTDPGGHWEADSVGGAVFRLGYDLSVTELEVLASRRRLGTWVDADPGTHTPHAPPDVLAALWPGISFETPAVTAPGVNCYEVAGPALPEGGTLLREFRVVGADAPEPAGNAVWVAHGSPHPAWPEYRARETVAEELQPRFWRVRVVYEHEPAAAQ